MNTTTQILEGPRLDPDMDVKLDTSLEADLQMEQAISDASLSSTVSEIMDLDKRSCCNNKFVAQGNFDTCFHCGAFVSKDGIKTFKSKKLNYVAFFPSKTIYQTMTRRSNKFDQSLNPEYSSIRQTYIEWVLEIADKLRISANSSHLAILLLDTVMFRDSSLTSKLQLYAPICLLIAAKAIELDERIPFIPKLRRYANPTFSVDDYRKAELHVLDMVDWNPQFSTALEINEFLMCQGVLFSSDKVEEGSKLSHEGLRENIHHENIHHIEIKTDDKENNENSYSDISTTGTNNDGTPLIPGNTLSHQLEEGSPINIALPIFQKHNSTPAGFETHKMDQAALMSVENKVEEIMDHIDANYMKLSTLLLKDIELIEWEPRVVSASVMAFFRCVNKVTPIWNDELETITQLPFSQISSCFDLIYSKYSTTFNPSTHKVLGVLSPSNQGTISSDLKVAKANPNFSEKVGCLQAKTELANKTNIINKSSVGNDNSQNDLKLFERKPVVNHPPKFNVSTATVSHNQMRDDLRFKTRYINGTANTEVPQRVLTKNHMTSGLVDAYMRGEAMVKK